MQMCKKTAWDEWIIKVVDNLVLDTMNTGNPLSIDIPRFAFHMCEIRESEDYESALDAITSASRCNEPRSTATREEKITTISKWIIPDIIAANKVTHDRTHYGFMTQAKEGSQVTLYFLPTYKNEMFAELYKCHIRFHHVIDEVVPGYWKLENPCWSPPVCMANLAKIGDALKSARSKPVTYRLFSRTDLIPAVALSLLLKLEKRYLYGRKKYMEKMAEKSA